MGIASRSKTMMPRSWCLLQTIKRLLKATEVMRVPRVLKTWRLAHKDLLLKKTIKKGFCTSS
jgi:hypothetical protein